MVCKKCGRKAGLFRRLTLNNLCTNCESKISSEADQLFKSVDGFIAAFPYSARDLSNFEQIKQIDERLDAIEKLRSLHEEISHSTLVSLQPDKVNRMKERLLEFRARAAWDKDGCSVNYIPNEIKGDELVYHYEGVLLAYVQKTAPDYSKLRLCDEVSLKLEPENSYDPGAVAVYKGDMKIGYLFRGKLQQMVRDWIERIDTIYAAICDLDDSESVIKLILGFYQDPIERLEKYESIEAPIVKATGDRKDDFERLSIDDILDYNPYDDTFVLTDDFGDEVGELSKSVSKKLLKEKVFSELVPVVSECWYDSANKYHVKVKVYFTPRPE